MFIFVECVKGSDMIVEVEECEDDWYEIREFICEVGV